MSDIRLHKLPFSAITVSGIHLNLLEKQASGLTGHMHEVFPDLSDSSAWLGGNQEAWERGPYYMDGLFPLSYLIQNPELKNLSDKWSEALLSSQTKVGFFGPKSNLDWWPRAVAIKTVVSLAHSNQKERAISFLEKYFEYQRKQIPEQPFDFWAYARGMEGWEALDFMEAQGFDVSTLRSLYTSNTIDWKSFFEDFPYEKKTTHYLNRRLFLTLRPILVLLDTLAKKSKHPKIQPKEKILKNRDQALMRSYLTTHGVNLAMALKYLAYQAKVEEKEVVLFSALNQILEYHGNALDLFSSDEHLNGTDPSQGVELCVVVEMMYTMEELMRTSKSMKAADYLEFYAYNALLTEITPDFCSHQYLQQVNQLDCEVKHHPFYDAGKYATTFGVAPNFGCCAANMHQGWPKMMHSAVMKEDNGIVVFLYIDGEYTVKFDSGEVSIRISSQYPFSDSVRITCLKNTVSDPIRFTFRIPYSAKTQRQFQGKTGWMEDMNQFTVESFQEGEDLSLRFDFDTKTVHHPNHQVSIRRGPILFANELSSKERKLKGVEPFHDRAFSSLDSFDGELLLKEGKAQTSNLNMLSSNPDFHENSVSMEVIGRNKHTRNKETWTLVPYGLTTLRMTQFLGEEDETY